MSKDYIAGRAEWMYPELGDQTPAGGATVLLLTEGGVCIRGTWGTGYGLDAWAPLPKIDKARHRQLMALRALRYSEQQAAKAEGALA
jgi:hypothetical protein